MFEDLTIGITYFLLSYPAFTKIYTLSLHDALPIYTSITHAYSIVIGSKHITLNATGGGFQGDVLATRSEERFSRNAETDLVCRLLLEKKNNDPAMPDDSLLCRAQSTSF